METNLALDCKEFDEYLIDTYQDCIMDFPGIHYIFRFNNGFGASVVKCFGSKGYEQDLWELGVILFEEENKKATDEYMLWYPYTILKGNDVLGSLNDTQVREILQKIKDL